MHLKSLTIKNFRGFPKEGITIDLHSDLTAFIGRNGSGKTTILEAISLLFGNDYLPSKISEKDFCNEAIGIKDEIFIEGQTNSPFFITIDVRSSTNQLETIIIPCNKVMLTIKRRERPEKVLDDPFTINKNVKPVIGNIDDSIYKKTETARKIIRVTEIQGGYTVFYKLADGSERSARIVDYQLTYNPGRLTNCPKSYYLTKERDGDIAGSYSLIAKVLTDLHWKYKKKRSSDTTSTIKEDYDKLADSLRSIIEQKGELIASINEKVKAICAEDKDFQLDFVDIEQPYKSAFVAKRKGEKLLLPEHLGSGFNILLAYALFSYIADQEKLPVIFIIDEPELHLHTDWQQKMYQVFTKQNNLQVIYSTQSENYISLKNWRQIRLIADTQIFPRYDAYSIQATDGQEGTPSDYLDDYANKNLHISLILKENLELFFTKKSLLVEGPSEKYALPKLLKLSECLIEDYSLSIIPAWGKTKIKNYQMICKVFGIDYFTIFDQDKTDEKEPEAENNAIESNSQTGKLVKFSTSFEKLLGIPAEEKKFQKLIEVVDDLSTLDMVNSEIKASLESIKNFINN